jgi:hypothetical protein
MIELHIIILKRKEQSSKRRDTKNFLRRPKTHKTKKNYQTNPKKMTSLRGVGQQGTKDI